MNTPLGPKRSLTVADVAAAAGVSKATAARALGGYGSVGADLRRRIEAAALRLDYRPNELARTMATGRSGTIGVVVGDIENPFFGLAVRGIADAAKARGFGVILTNSGEDAREECAGIDMLMAKRVDGLVVAPASMHERAHLIDAMARGVPLVLLDREVIGVSADAAIVDDKAAARAATRLLVETGHRRIAYVTATEAPTPVFLSLSQIVLTTVSNRIAGFLEEAAAAGLAEPERFIRLGASATTASQAILRDLLGAEMRPSAIVASDSKIALEVFRAAKALGLSIPGDLSLVTFDDAEWTSALSPAVTVLAQPSYRLGVEAIRMLAERIADPHAPVRRCVLDATLIARESVSPPRDDPAKLEVRPPVAGLDGPDRG